MDEQQTYIEDQYVCENCGTVMHLNRAEPGCIQDHPGYWHLEWIEWSECPCPPCSSWRQPFDEVMQELVDDPDTDIVLFFPYARTIHVTSRLSMN